MLGSWGGGKPQAWRKVTAAYCRVYGFGYLRADCRGLRSAPEPYALLGEYETTLPLPLQVRLGPP